MNKKDKEPEKIELVNPVKIENMTTQGNQNQNKPKEQPKEQPKTPERPKIRIIPETKEPPKGKPLHD